MKFYFCGFKTSLFFLSFVFFISSCDVVKRKYMKGFYVVQTKKAKETRKENNANKVSLTHLQTETKNPDPRTTLTFQDPFQPAQPIKKLHPGLMHYFKPAKITLRTVWPENKNKINTIKIPQQFIKEKTNKKSMRRDKFDGLGLVLLGFLFGLAIIPPLVFTLLMADDNTEKRKFWKIFLMWLAWLPVVFCIFFFIAKLWLCILICLAFNTIYSIVTGNLTVS